MQLGFGIRTAVSLTCYLFGFGLRFLGCVNHITTTVRVQVQNVLFCF